MKKINVMLANLEATTIPIGRVGENLHTQVKINCVGIFQNYPNATVSLTVQPPQGAAYPAVTTRDGIYIEWDVKNSDLTTEGTGRIQLTFTDDEEVIKTVIGYTQILSSIEPTGTAPTPIENWIDEANAVLADLESFDDISASATALAAGADPTAEITEVEGHKNIALGIPAGASGEMVTETVTGTTPSITGVANHRYLCGEVSTISITPPASGIIDVIFTSGTTAAVLTIPNTVTLPVWFDATSLETSVTYEINIADGFGVVAKWA